MNDNLKESLQLLENCKFDDALNAINDVIKTNPLHATAWRIKASVFMSLERYDDALVSLDTALGINSGDVIALRMKGATLFHMKRYSFALDACNKALAIAPDDEYNLELNGGVLHYLEREVEAFESVEKSLKINPVNESAWRLKGVILNNQGKLEEALNSVNKALEIEPDSPDDLRLKSNILSDLKRYQDSVEALNKLKEINSDMSPKYILENFPLALENSAFRMKLAYAWQKKDIEQVFDYCVKTNTTITGGEAWIVRKFSELRPDEPRDKNLDPRYRQDLTILGRTPEHVIYGIFPVKNSNLPVVFAWSANKRRDNQKWFAYVNTTIKEAKSTIKRGNLKKDVLSEYSTNVYYNLSFQREDKSRF